MSLSQPTTAAAASGPLAGGPTLLGIGAAKAGTTWLAEVLGAHPQVFVHPQKELNALLYRDLDSRIDEYRAYFDGAEDTPVRCDFSVRYLNADLAPAAASRLAPNAKLLMLLRNPVDQVQSHYWHLRRQNFHQVDPVLDPPDIFGALDRYPELILEPALYAKHLDRWLAHFPRERLMLIDNRDLRARPNETLAEICDFLGVDRFDFSTALGQTSTTDARGGVQPRGGVLGRLFPKLYVGISRGPYRWFKTAFGVERADGLKRLLRLRQVSEKVFFKPGYPALDAADRRRLYDRFAADIDRLEALAPFVSSWRPQ
ncbi:hypothetical protein GVN21_11790 [Caulobacter sp. SLTY]|uniref:sulfotransferase domain-containing protein n=1 Tax=Caulobacter sp. SLTY TaxID=2683262 RepID=UPI00141209E4|nr:sulfotransferase domain-containing protein [Caulobacter sp. SLTY]NBB16039.1 hypothetical protein [Caulobacter sp. SLTY]